MEISTNIDSAPSGQSPDHGRRIARLEQEVGHLATTVRLLTSLIDVDEVNAALRLRELSPTNAQLVIWAKASEAPDHLATQPEERPW